MYQDVIELSATIYALSFVGLFGLCLLTLAVLYFRDSNEETNLVRAYVHHLLGRSRLGQVLRMRGNSRSAYVREFGVPVIRQQLAGCQRCQHVAECDRSLQTGEVGDGGLAYCPNLPAIKAFEKILR